MFAFSESDPASRSTFANPLPQLPRCNRQCSHMSLHATCRGLIPPRHASNWTIRCTIPIERARSIPSLQTRVISFSRALGVALGNPCTTTFEKYYTHIRYGDWHVNHVLLVSASILYHIHTVILYTLSVRECAPYRYASKAFNVH